MQRPYGPRGSLPGHYHVQFVQDQRGLERYSVCAPCPPEMRRIMNHSKKQSTVLLHKDCASTEKVGLLQEANEVVFLWANVNLDFVIENLNLIFLSI